MSDRRPPWSGSPPPAPSPERDPYAVSLAQQGSLWEPWPGSRPTPKQSAPERPKPSELDQFAGRTHQALQAIDFPHFVSGLISGTFQAIVDATAQQMREFAGLVANLSRTLDDFAHQNVTDDQVEAWLAQTYPADVRLRTSQHGVTRLVATDEGHDTPSWLDRFGLGGQKLDTTLSDGALVRAARNDLASERMQQLSTMVLMGINRIVVDEGNIRAKLQFHAVASHATKTKYGQGQGGSMATQNRGIAGMYQPISAPVTAKVSTAHVNSQRDASMRADLMGEVSVKFSTQTFPLDRFADSAAMELIDRHAHPWRQHEGVRVIEKTAKGSVEAEGPSSSGGES